MATMQAIRIHGFGGAEVLRLDEIPLPSPGASELLLRVRAASVNPVDYKTRQGKFPPVSADKLPVTLGCDVSGIVAGGFREGDEIYVMLPPGSGGYAEYALAEARQVAIKPVRLDHVHAAAVPLAALTAWQGLFDNGKLASGQRVLVQAGAGGVGHFAVQFAKARGAFVYATASARDLDFLRELGVDRAIDYKTERFEEIATNLDLVYDLVAGEVQARSLPLLRPGGRLVSTLAEPPQEECRARGITGLHYMAHPDGRQLAEITAMIDEGKLRVEVAQTFPLAEARAAQERLEQGGIRGKIVLEVG